MKRTDGMARREFLKLVAATGALSLPVFRHSEVLGANWPTKPIRMTVQYAVGGGTDIFCRGFAHAMEEPLGGTIEVGNMPGSVGAIATDFVLKKPADGYSWLAASNFSKFLRPMGYHKSVPYKDWQWFAVAISYMGWAVKPESPFKTMADVIDASKKKPVTMSHSGVGGIWHEGDGLLARAAGVKFNYVPYKGGAPAVLAALQGEVDVASCGMHEQIEFLRTGKMRNLAIFLDEPMTVDGITFQPITKYVPQAKPFTPFTADATIGLRRETPLEILKAVHKAYLIAAKNPRFAEVLKKNVGSPQVLTPLESDKRAAFKECVTATIFEELGIAKMKRTDLGLPSPEEFEKWWPPKDYKPRLT